MSKSIADQKLELIQWLSNVEDASTIDQINHIRKTNIKDWWETISAAEKNSIEKGISDAEAGKLIDHQDVRKRYEKWL